MISPRPSPQRHDQAKLFFVKCQVTQTGCRKPWITGASGRGERCSASQTSVCTQSTRVLVDIQSLIQEVLGEPEILYFYQAPQ